MSKIMYEFEGPGFYPGIPARDLDDEDWARMFPWQKEIVERSEFYVKKGSKPVPKENKVSKPRTESKGRS